MSPWVRWVMDGKFGGDGREAPGSCLLRANSCCGTQTRPGESCLFQPPWPSEGKDIPFLYTNERSHRVYFSCASVTTSNPFGPKLIAGFKLLLLVTALFISPLPNVGKWCAKETYMDASLVKFCKGII